MNNKVKALHILVNATGHLEAFKRISQKYSTSVSSFPGNRKLLFYSHWNKLRSGSAQQKLLKAVQKQKSFLDTVQDDVCQDILSLDISVSNRPTLQEIIGNIKS